MSEREKAAERLAKAMRRQGHGAPKNGPDGCGGFSTAGCIYCNALAAYEAAPEPRALPGVEEIARIVEQACIRAWRAGWDTRDKTRRDYPEASADCVTDASHEADECARAVLRLLGGEEARGDVLAARVMVIGCAIAAVDAYRAARAFERAHPDDMEPIKSEEGQAYLRAFAALKASVDVLLAIEREQAGEGKGGDDADAS